MAKIKTIKTVVNGVNYEIPIKCNTKGLFTCDIPAPLRSIISDMITIQSTQYQSLQSLESMINSKLAEYKESTIKTKLVIAVRFKAKGKIIHDDQGYPLPMFRSGEPFHVDSFTINSGGDVICFGYDVLMQETVNGHTEYYKTGKYKDGYLLPHVPPYRKIDCYVGESRIYSVKDYACILPFDDTILANLEGIRGQLKKAAMFLGGLLSQDDASKILSGDNVKLLDSK